MMIRSSTVNKNNNNKKKKELPLTISAGGRSSSSSSSSGKKRGRRSSLTVSGGGAVTTAAYLSSEQCATIAFVGLIAFLMGCFVTISLTLHATTTTTTTTSSSGSSSSSSSSISDANTLVGDQLSSFKLHQPNGSSSSSSSSSSRLMTSSRSGAVDSSLTTVSGAQGNNNIIVDGSSSSSGNNKSVLNQLKIMVVIIAFDFSQIPHMEEVLDSYHDMCLALSTGSGESSKMDITIVSTVPYPVTLIDLFNTRFYCPNWSLTILLKPKSLKLHLPDVHRKLFYDNINNYDLFIYTEDDIRVTTTTAVTYLEETYRIKQLLLQENDEANNNNSNNDQKQKHDPSDYNVGIVRYEYNYPANVIIDDNTRHATQNVTRVYWEHSKFERPNIIPNAIEELDPATNVESVRSRYITMHNHHQGMYLATRDLLLAWKDRPNCDFSNARNRPGRGPQPTEGTQRVWMSSQMLYGKRHCNVQQVLPKSRFPALTVLHLPNKNYRRVGKYRNRKFADGSEVFEKPHESLLKAMEVHVAMRQAFFMTIPTSSSQKSPPVYRGTRMVDDIGNGRRNRTPLLERRMAEYQAYVDRGGILTQQDLMKTALVEEQ